MAESDELEPESAPNNASDDPLILEYEPLSELHKSLPRQYGLLRESVFYTSLDVSPVYLALGSTKGLVVVYEMYSWHYRTFKETSESVTVIKINSFVQGLAFGCSNGDVVVTLFSNIRDSETEVKRYIVHEVDRTTVSALEWEEGGERLYVGYTSGKLVQVDFQYEKGTCAAITLLVGSWNICQLSTYNGHLLVSSLTSSLMLEVSTGRLKQIGQAQRKQGPYGGCFGLHDMDPSHAYVARPGFRIWRANSTGEVLSTIKLKKAVMSCESPPVMLLNEDITFPPPPDSAHFCLLYPWHSRYLVTYSQHYLWVLDPLNVSIVGTHRHSREILSVCPCNDHIFFLTADKLTVRRVSIRSDLQKYIHRAVLPAEMVPASLPPPILIDTADSRDRPGKTDPVDSANLTAELPLQTNYESGSGKVSEERKPAVKGSPILSLFRSFHKPQPSVQQSTPPAATEQSTEQSKLKLPLASNVVTEVEDDPSRSKSVSSVDGRPLALLAKGHQIKRLANFTEEQDFGSMVKQVKKKGKKKASGANTSASTTSVTQKSSVPAPDPPSIVKEYPTIDDILAATVSREAPSHQQLQQAGTSPEPEAVDTAGREPLQSQSVQDEAIVEADTVAQGQTVCVSSPVQCDGVRDSGDTETTVVKSEREATAEPVDRTIVPESHEQKTSVSDSTSPKPEEVVVPSDSDLLTGDSTPSSSVPEEQDWSKQMSSENVTACKVTTCMPPNDAMPPCDDFQSHPLSDSDEVSPLPLPPKENQVDGSSEVHDLEDSTTASEYQPLDRRSEVVLQETPPMFEASPVSPFLDRNLTDSVESSQTRTQSQTAEQDTPVLTNLEVKADPKELHPVEQDDKEDEEEEVEDDEDEDEDEDEEMEMSIGSRLVDECWMPISFPYARHQVTSLCASADNLWAIDSKGRLWYRTLTTVPGQPSPEWTSDLDTSVNLLSVAVSLDGDVLWGITNKGVLVKSLVTQRGKMVVKGWQPLALQHKKTTAVSIALTGRGAWVLCDKGQLLYRSEVSGALPNGSAWSQVPTSADLLSLATHRQSLWAVSQDRSTLLVRTGFANGLIGTDWRTQSAPCNVSHLSVAEGMVWIVGEDGRVFFRCGISGDDPCGSDPWWEVIPKNGNFEPEQHMLQRFKSLKSLFTSEDPCSVVAVANTGVWVLHNTGQITTCMSTVCGSHYSHVTNDDLFGISTWKEVALGGASGLRGVAWLVRDDGILFVCDMHGEVAKVDLQSPAFAVASSKYAAWVLTEDALFSREGFGRRNPAGTLWHKINLQQLQDRQVSGIGLGRTCSWAVDNRGDPWFRFDVLAQDKESGFAQVWIPAEREGVPNPLAKVAMGPSPSYIWAVDTKGCLYVRKGSTADYPIGRGWVAVEGAKAKDVCISAHHVWILSPEGQIFCRDGVQPAKVEGRSWRPISSSHFSRISCTQDGEVWGITEEGAVLKRSAHILKLKYSAETLTKNKTSFTEGFVGTVASDLDQDWEVIDNLSM